MVILSYPTQTFSDYNRFTNLPSLPFNITTYLFDNDNLCKLLYYDTPNALDLPNLTDDQKRSMIYKGQTDSSQYRIYFNPFNDDAFEKEISMLRIYTPVIIPNNNIISEVVVAIDIVVHNKLYTLDMVDYRNRYDEIFRELMVSLNGNGEIGGVSPLFFNRMTNNNCRAVFKEWSGKNRYGGYMINMTTVISNPSSGKC